MSGLVMTGLTNYEHASAETIISYQASRRRTVHPIPVWDEHDFTSLHRGCYPVSDDPSGHFNHPPASSLCMYTFDDAYVVFDDRLDNVVITSDGLVVEDPSCFRSRALTDVGTDLRKRQLPEFELDAAFVAFDAAWYNYFHFLCHGISQAVLADRFIPSDYKILIPDYDIRAVEMEMGFSKATYESVLALSGLRDRVTRVPRGIFRVKKLRFMWPKPINPTDVLDLPDFYTAFSGMRARLARRPGRPRRRVYLSRALAPSLRVREADHLLARDVCLDLGFDVVEFEKLSFIEQASLMLDTDCIVAPHGAGLANILFANDNLGVVELHSELEQNGVLRPFFFQLAAGRGQAYTALNSSRGELTEQRLVAAIAACCR